MNHEEKMARAEQLANEYEKRYGGCAQCVLAAIGEVTEGISDSVVKSASGLAGGVGLTGATCGAVTGGVMALSSFRGREIDNLADSQRMGLKSYILAKKLVDKFNEEYGSIQCYDIQTKIMGRKFNLWNRQENSAFEAAGGHQDKCPVVCGNSAKWVLELLIEEDLL